MKTTTLLFFLFLEVAREKSLARRVELLIDKLGSVDMDVDTGIGNSDIA